MGYAELMELPIPLFWELSRNVERIRAEEDLRFINAVGALFSEDGKDYTKWLRDGVGTVVESNQEDDIGFDKAAFNILKAKIGG